MGVRCVVETSTTPSAFVKPVHQSLGHPAALLFVEGLKAALREVVLLGHVVEQRLVEQHKSELLCDESRNLAALRASLASNRDVRMHLLFDLSACPRLLQTLVDFERELPATHLSLDDRGQRRQSEFPHGAPPCGKPRRSRQLPALLVSTQFPPASSDGATQIGSGGWIQSRSPGYRSNKSCPPPFKVLH